MTDKSNTEKPKIDKLTPEQEVMMMKYREKYFKLGWNTQPSNREAAETAMTALYKRMNLKIPKFVWFDSPFAALETIKESVSKKEWEQTNRLSGVDGNLEAHWVAFYMFGLYLRDDMYSADDTEHLKTWDALVHSTGPCYPYENYCLMTERPIKATYDEREQLHAIDGPALLYKDGFKIYAVNGLRLPTELGEQIIERPWTMTLEQIEKQENGDIQTIMQDRWCYEEKDNAGDHVGQGGGRWLKETGSETVHMDTYVAYGDTALMRVLLKGKDGRKYLCCSDSSTDRVYYIPVDRNAKTCEEAHMSINGGIKDSDIVISA